MNLESAVLPPPNLDAYVSALANNGTRIIPGSRGSYWVRHESFALMRIPGFCVTPRMARRSTGCFGHPGLPSQAT